MQLYHVTTPKAAAAILAGGFRDATGTYMTDQEWTGVWVSAEPLDMNEGAHGEALLIIDFPPGESAIAEYEWVQDIGYREWLVPAALLNEHGHTHRASREEEDALDWSQGATLEMDRLWRSEDYEEIQRRMDAIGPPSSLDRIKEIGALRRRLSGR